MPDDDDDQPTAAPMPAAAQRGVLGERERQLVERAIAELEACRKLLARLT
jgi:hypothetical protein